MSITDLPLNDMSSIPSPAPVQVVGRRPVHREFEPIAVPVPESQAVEFDRAVGAALALIHRSSGDTELLVTRMTDGSSVGLSWHHVAAGASLADVCAEVGARGASTVPLELLLTRSAEAAEGARADGAPPAHLEVAPDVASAGATADLALLRPTTGQPFTLVGNGTIYDQLGVERIARMIGHILQQNSAADVGDLDVLSETDRHLVLHEWNETTTRCPEVYPHEMVARVARQSPDKVAVLDADGQHHSYAALQRRVELLAGAMASAGVGPDTPVGMLLPRTVDAVAAHLAAFWNGAPVVLLDPAHPEERTRFAITDSGTGAIVTTQQLRPLVPEGHVVIDVAAIAAEPVRPPTTPDPAAVAHIAYTSGSSGKPKAVQLRYGPMRQLAHTLIEQCHITSDSRGSWLSAASLGMVQVDMLPILTAGATVVLSPNDIINDPAALKAWIETENVSHVLMITSMAEMMWALPWADNTPLRHVRVAGERCRSWPSPDLPFTVLNVYGSSEATVVSTADLTGLSQSLGRKRSQHEPPVGRPVNNVRMYVLDDRYRPVPPGVVGNLHVSGESLSKGYLEREGVDNSVFEDNPIEGDPHPVLYRTGDLAQYWSDGTIEVTGRDDDMVKVRGHRVSLGEVEACLLTHPAVAQCAVQAVGAHDGTTQLVAHLETESGRGATHGAMREFLSDRLPSPMIPARFLVGELPRVNGKIDRQHLPECPATRPELDTAWQPPTTRQEAILVEQWEKALELDGLGVNDNFFELGGDSLRGVRMLATLQDEHGLSMEIAELLAHPTPRECAPLLSRNRADDLPQVQPDPAAANEPFALNESQQALWLGRGAAVELGDVGCHGYFEWDNPDLDIDRFRTAWARLVERHDMLRAVILADGTQRVLDTSEVDAGDIVVDDLRHLSDPDADLWINELRERMSHDVMDASTWPLYETRISILPNGHSRIHLSLDMLIVDAWSLYQALIPDLIDLYENPSGQLQPLELTFRDYSLAREQVRGTESYSRAKDYWMERLDTLPAAPELPRATNPGTHPRFDRYELDVPAPAWQQLKDLAKGNNVTPSGLIVTAFSEVLRAWSDNDQFTINFPVSDRRPLHPQVDSLVGDFTNTLLVAVDKVDGTVAERAQSIQHQIWQDLDHRAFTGVEVLREIARRQSGRLRPAMPIVLTSLLGHPGHRSSSGLGQECHGVSQTPQVLLDVQVREIDGVLHVKWDHLPEAFPENMIADMFDAFSCMLEQLADSRTWARERLELRPEHQIEQRRRVNDTATPVPETTLGHLFVDRVHTSSEAPAVISADQALTWGDLGRAANNVAKRLPAVHTSNRLVAVLIPKGWQQYAAIHGVLLAGHAYLPLDPNHPDERLTALLDQAGVDAVVTIPEQAGRAQRMTPAPVVEVTESLLHGELPVHAADQEPTDIAYVIFTSGSTGRPKGVAVTHRSAVNHVIDASRRFGLGPDDRHLATAGVHFDMSVFDLFAPLVHGGSVVVPPPAPGPDPAAWLQLAHNHQVSFWTAVPALMELVCLTWENQRDARPLALTNVVLAGDWIKLDLPGRITQLAPDAKVTSCGGPTETTNWSIAYPVDHVDPEWPSVPYGKPMANAHYHIVDSRLQHRPTWAVGEMAVEGQAVLAQGYWRDPERTAERFVTDPESGARWYLTGDLGRYLPDGNIEILGRNDFQVKIHGHRIEIGEVERALTSIPGVSDGVVVAAGTAGAAKLIAWVTGPQAPDPVEVGRQLRRVLPDYMVPQQVRTAEQLPLTGNGKVDRKALAARASEGSTDTTADPQPQSPLALVVGECAAVVLEKEAVTGTANFFAEGGDSLLAMHLAVLLSDALNCEVDLGEVLQTDTLGDLAELIAEDPDRGPAALAAVARLQQVSS